MPSGFDHAISTWGVSRRVRGACCDAPSPCASAPVGGGSGSEEPTQVPPSEPASPAQLPAEDGEALLEARCSTCHSADRARQVTKTRDGWDQSVSRMIDKGAQLSEAEKTLLVDYLTETYGP